MYYSFFNRTIPVVFLSFVCTQTPLDVSRKHYFYLQVQVTLSDVNDNPPVFSRLNYTVTVFETIAVGTDILQLFTSDADIGNNSISHYYKIMGSGDFDSEFKKYYWY